MTEQQQPDDDSYPAHWGYSDSGLRSSDGAAGSPIANMNSGMGFDAEYSPTDDTAAYPRHWGYNRSENR
jgi:hypothetical protein